VDGLARAGERLEAVQLELEERNGRAMARGYQAGAHGGAARQRLGSYGQGQEEQRREDPGRCETPGQPERRGGRRRSVGPRGTNWTDRRLHRISWNRSNLFDDLASVRY